MMLESQEVQGPSLHEAQQIVDVCAQILLPNLSDTDSHTGSDEAASPGESYADPCAKLDVPRMTLPHVSVSLPSDSDNDEDKDSLFAPVEQNLGWRPGSDAGDWVHQRFAALAQQGQVLLVNVVLKCMALGAALCKTICMHSPNKSRNHGAWHFKAAATLLCLSVDRVKNIFDKLQLNAWRPHSVAVACRKRRCPRRPSTASAPSLGSSAKDKHALETRAINALKILVREALFCAFSGGSDISFTAALSRFMLAGVDIGTKYRTHHFIELVEQVASAMSQSLTLDGINARLPGLLIPSDFSIIFDGVSIESSARARPCKSSMRDLLLSLMLDFDLDCLRLLRREAATRANTTNAWCWTLWLLFLEAAYLFPGFADPW